MSIIALLVAFAASAQETGIQKEHAIPRLRLLELIVLSADDRRAVCKLQPSTVVFEHALVKAKFVVTTTRQQGGVSVSNAYADMQKT